STMWGLRRSIATSSITRMLPADAYSHSPELFRQTSIGHNRPGLEPSSYLARRGWNTPTWWDLGGVVRKHWRFTMRWSDQVAVVTGGSRGIGRATALLLARRGCAVCVNYTARPESAEAVVSEIKAYGGRAIAFSADVGERDAVTSMIEHVTSEFGLVTIL